MSNWLHIDEQTDVLASLEACLLIASELGEKPELWKQMIIGLHNAVQGAMVCHLSGTMQVGALSDQSAQKTIEWHEKDRKKEIKRVLIKEDDLGPVYRPKTPSDAFPDQRLADPQTLFDRLFSESKRIEEHVKDIDIDEHQKNSFKKLNELRREFVHFTPKGWSIELSGLPSICLDMLKIVETIKGCGWAFRHLDDPHRTRLDSVLESLVTKLQPRK